jgi:hypothetical protein
MLWEYNLCTLLRKHRKWNALCLEAIEPNETTCSLPLHLLEKVDEVRCADGPNTVDKLILTLEELAKTCSVQLLEVTKYLENLRLFLNLFTGPGDARR